MDMSRLAKLPNILMLPLRPLENGETMERLKCMSQKVEQDISTLTMMKIDNEKISSIVEYQPPSREKIFEDKLSLPNSHIQTKELSKTLVESIGNERVLSPYWKDSKVEMSKVLLSSIGTDCVDSASNYLKNSSQSLMLNSWFISKTNISPQNKNSPKISSQSSIFTHAVTWEREDMVVKESKSKVKPSKVKIQIKTSSHVKTGLKAVEKCELSEHNKLIKVKDKLFDNFDKLFTHLSNKDMKKIKSSIVKLDEVYSSSPVHKEVIIKCLEDKLKSRKYKIFPTKNQKKLFNVWFGSARYIYNLCIDHTNRMNKIEQVRPDHMCKLISTEKDNLIAQTDLKLRCIFNNTPKDIRANIVRDFCSSYNTNIANRLKFNIQLSEDLKRLKVVKFELIDLQDSIFNTHVNEDEVIKIYKSIGKCYSFMKHVENQKDWYTKGFVMKYKTKKDMCDYIKLQSCKVNSFENSRLSIFPRSGTGYIRVDKKLKEINHDYIIKFTKPHGYHIIAPSIYKPELVKNKFKTVMGVDPGIRTLFTTADTNGVIREYGIGWNDVLNKKMRHIDYLKSKMDGYREGGHRILYLRTKDLRRRVERKMYAMRDDMHKKIAKDMLDNCDSIILPKLSSKFVMKNKNAKTLKKSFMLSSHCKFHDYISWKANKDGKGIHKLNERYTTKTCLNCGILNTIGSNKTYICDECGFRGDRDVSSAFNILLKHLKDWKVSTFRQVATA